MKKRLTMEQFREAIKGLDVGERTLEIARAVLVEGVPQANFVLTLHLSRGAVSQSVKRVWAAHEEKCLPAGYEKITVILPKHQAHLVRQWATKARQDMGK